MDKNSSRKIKEHILGDGFDTYYQDIESEEEQKLKDKLRRKQLNDLSYIEWAGDTWSLDDFTDLFK